MSLSNDPAPELTVIIVAWQARDDTLRCLRSLELHARIAHEVIVVDDGSQDGTADAVRAAHPAVRVLSKPRNEGLVAGRNDALAAIAGRLVLMLDADIVVLAGAIPALASVLDGDPQVGIVSPKLLNEDGTVQPSCRRWPPLLLPLLRRGPYARLDPDPRAHRHHLMRDFAHDEQRPVVWTMGAAQMWRAELIGRIGTYDPRISSYGGEDQDWCMRTWAAGLQVHYVPHATMLHGWQRMTNRRPFGRQSRRALRDHFYLQAKHRRLRSDPRIEPALR